MCCTYTTMELDTLDIINVVTVDKRHVGGKSVSMEKEAFIKTFDVLMGELNIKEIVTDAHVQISSLMSKDIFELYLSLLAYFYAVCVS